MSRPVIHGLDAVYHCTSRIVGGQKLLEKEDKEQFRRLMRRQARFCGLDILTHCVMSNHVHLLVRVPGRIDLEDEVLLRRIKAFHHGKKLPEPIKTAARHFQQTGKLPLDFRDRYLARMGNVSVFNKELKQNFSRWYNQEHERFGTLWAERFKSVIVEERFSVLRFVAAYIDLNPVRAGLLLDPAKYPFCGYGEAAAGDKEARAGLLSFLDEKDPNQALVSYRAYLFVRAGKSGHSDKHALDPEVIRQVLDQHGKLSLHQALRVRMRWMTDGVFLGSAAFVDRMYKLFETDFSPRRKTGARPFRGVKSNEYRSARDLRVDALG